MYTTESDEHTLVVYFKRIGGCHFEEYDIRIARAK